MNNNSVCLYWNARLVATSPTPSRKSEQIDITKANLTDIASTIFSRPYNSFYPRVNRKHSSNQEFNQFDILLGAILSHRKISFSIIRANLELGEYDSQENREKIKAALNKCISEDGCIELRWERPSKIEEWIQDARSFAEIAGKKTPCVYHFNHDHYFVSSQDILQGEIEQISKLVSRTNERNTGFYLIESSHFSEKYAQYKSMTQSEGAEDDFAGSYTQSLGTQPHRPVYAKLGNNKFGLALQGEFIASADFSQYFWSSLLMQTAKIPEYLARPDWPGIVQPIIEMSFCLPSCELFAHYDGIGDEALLFDIIEPLSNHEPYLNTAKVFAPNCSKQEVYVNLSEDFLRTRSFYFYLLIKEILEKPEVLSNETTLTQAFRGHILPCIAIEYLNNSNYAKVCLEYLTESAETGHETYAFKLIESALSMLPRYFMTAQMSIKLPKINQER